MGRVGPGFQSPQELRRSLPALGRVLAQPDDVTLRRALGGEKSDAGILGNLRQAPDLGVKSQLLLIVRDRQVHMAQVSDQPRIYGHDPEH